MHQGDLPANNDKCQLRHGRPVGSAFFSVIHAAPLGGILHAFTQHVLRHDQRLLRDYGSRLLTAAWKDACMTEVDNG